MRWKKSLSVYRSFSAWARRRVLAVFSPRAVYTRSLSQSGRQVFFAFQLRSTVKLCCGARTAFQDFLSTLGFSEVHENMPSWKLYIVPQPDVQGWRIHFREISSSTLTLNIFWLVFIPFMSQNECGLEDIEEKLTSKKKRNKTPSSCIRYLVRLSKVYISDKINIRKIVFHCPCSVFNHFALCQWFILPVL